MKREQISKQHEIEMLYEQLEVKNTMIKSYQSDVECLQEQLKKANALLKGLCDDSPCQFDHNGYCQEHGSTDGNYICVQGELKEYLERYGVK